MVPIVSNKRVKAVCRPCLQRSRRAASILPVRLAPGRNSGGRHAFRDRYPSEAAAGFARRPATAPARAPSSFASRLARRGALLPPSRPLQRRPGGYASAARPQQPRGGPAGRTNGSGWRWDRWAQSGRSRWQGGTITGVTSKLDYLRDLGATVIWLSPVFKQRGHLDTYHAPLAMSFVRMRPTIETETSIPSRRKRTASLRLPHIG